MGKYVIVQEDDEVTAEPTADVPVVVGRDTKPYVITTDNDEEWQGWETNWLTKALKVPVHGMMDFLHATVLRPGSGGWRATTQVMEYVEDKNVKEFFDEDEPPSKLAALKKQAEEGYEDLPWYLKGLAAQPYADPTATIEFLKGGGGKVLAKGFWEGFTYDPDIEVETAWDITASGTGETRALDFLSSPAGPGKEWIEANPKKATAYGILLDMGYDPLTIFPFLITAPLTLTVKGLVFGVKKAHTTIPGLSKATSALAENQALQEVFSVFGVSLGKDAKEIQRMFVDNKHLLNAANFKTALATKEGQKEIAALAERLGIPYDTFTKEWYRRIEGMPWGGPEHGFSRGISDVEFTMLGATGALSPAHLAQMDISDFRLMLERATADIPLSLGDGAHVRGVKYGEISGKRAEELGISTGHYYPHIDASRSVLSRIFNKWRASRPSVGSQGRRTRIGTAEEKNIVEGSSYVLDPIKAKGIRQIDQNIIMAGQNFLRNAAERWGRTRATAPDDWVPIEGIGGVFFEPHVAKQLDKTFKALRNVKETSRILAGMDKGTRWWKMWALALRPSYHMRNLFGNMWNSFAVGGMKDPANFQKANQLLFQALRNDFKGSVKLGGLGDVKRKEIFDWLLEDGIVGVGRYSEEDILRGAGVDQSILNMMDRDSVKKAFVNAFNLSTNNTLLRASFRGGRAIENWNRTALYLDALQRTGSRVKAKRLVNDALFDYTDMTPQASRWMRNKAIPFYTWYFKNSPAIVKGLYRFPRRYERAGIIKENIEWGEDIPTYEQLSEFAQGRDPVFMDKFIGDDGRDDVMNVKRFINLLNYWPASDLNRLGDPADLIGELFNPYIKMVFEQVLNHSQYRDGKILKIPGANYGMGEMKDFMGLRMPARVAYLLQMFPLLSEIDRTNPGHVFGQATVDEETGQRTTSRAKFEPPWQAAVPTYDAEGEPILDATGQPVTSRATLRESRFEDIEGLPKFMAWLAGMKSYEYDKPTEFMRERSQNKRAIKSTISELKYQYKQALRKGNYDAAHEIEKLLQVFGQSQFESDPLQRGTSMQRLRAFGQ